MKLKVFSVYDTKVEGYLQPFFMQTKGAAIRAFSDAVNGGDGQFCKHPEDYILFEIGEYDDTRGELLPHKVNNSLGCALEFKKEAPNANIGSPVTRISREG